jgi:predicted nicotinamide N-methyase
VKPAEPMPTCSADGFVLAHTRVARAPLVPEVGLYLAEAVVPLWEATERRAGRHVPPPFWAFAWPGSQLLGRWVLDHPELVRGQRVLDFAAGCGLAGLCSSLSGAAHVLASDIDPLAAAAQQLNAQLNGLSLESVLEDLVGTLPAVDVVLAGDICYDRADAPRIVEWLHRLAAQDAQARLVLLADPTRAYAPTEHVQLLELRDVPTLQDLESAPTRQTRLLRVLPR